MEFLTINDISSLQSSALFTWSAPLLVESVTQGQRVSRPLHNQRLQQFPMFTSRSACNIFNQTAASLAGCNTYVQRAARRANILATNDDNDDDDGDKSHKFKSHLSALENYAAKTVWYKQRQQQSQQQQQQVQQQVQQQQQQVAASFVHLNS